MLLLMLRDCKIMFSLVPYGECLLVVVAVSTLHLFDHMTLTFNVIIIIIYLFIFVQGTQGHLFIYLLLILLLLLLPPALYVTPSL